MKKLIPLLLLPLTGCLSVGFHFGGTYSMPPSQKVVVAPSTQPTILPRENNPIPRTTDVLDSIISDLFSGEPHAN